MIRRSRLRVLLWAAPLAVGVLAAGIVLALARDTAQVPARGGFSFLPSLPGARATIWAAGDGANGSAQGRAVAARIARSGADRVLYLGDVYERGTARDFTRNYATTYGRLAHRTAPTPGNHDWPNHSTGYDPYWRRVTGRRVPAWYAFRAAGWTILSLNSEVPHGVGSPQYRWLRSRIRRPGTCRIAYWHRPRYSAGTHHGDQPDMAPIWQALRGHATIVVAGHEHDMQRFKPIGGITEFVSGAGGKSHYPIHSDRRLAFANDTADGALRLRLRPGSASFAFVAANGRVLDSGTLRCHR